jgi:hypothetical protein
MTFKPLLDLTRQPAHCRGCRSAAPESPAPING